MKKPHNILELNNKRRFYVVCVNLLTRFALLNNKYNIHILHVFTHTEREFLKCIHYRTERLLKIFAKRPYQTNKLPENGNLQDAYRDKCCNLQFLQEAYQQIAPDKHHASTGQAPDKPGANTRTQVNDLSMTCQPSMTKLELFQICNQPTRGGRA